MSPSDLCYWAAVRWAAIGEGRGVCRNRGWPSVPGRVVAELVSAAVARLTVRHPALGDTTVDTVVYQAATELVGTVGDAEQLSRLLDRRANARLTAMSGTPIAITRARDRRIGDVTVRTAAGSG